MKWPLFVSVLRSVESLLLILCYEDEDVNDNVFKSVQDYQKKKKHFHDISRFSMTILDKTFNKIIFIKLHLVQILSYYILLKLLLLFHLIICSNNIIFKLLV